VPDGRERTRRARLRPVAILTFRRRRLRSFWHFGLPERRTPMKVKLITIILALVSLFILGAGTVGEGWSCVGAPSP
jgi:hypothetical protein